MLMEQFDNNGKAREDMYGEHRGSSRDRFDVKYFVYEGKQR